MEGPLICSSMRKRSDWASLFPALLQSNNATGRWKESQLDTHDLAVPLTLPNQPLHLAFRALCLSPQDVGLLETSKRIERLYSLNGGQHVAIVFLMKQHECNSGAVMMMKLQLELTNGLEMPVIPLSSTGELSTTVMAFHHQLIISGTPRNQAVTTRSLLPYCSDIGKLPEHTTNIISDITTDFKDLIVHATTREGQQHLWKFLDGDAERVVKFWQDDFVVE